VVTSTATVLFTDLVGSTEMVVRLGSSWYDQLRRRHEALLRDAVEAHHGSLVKSLGDGIMATFNAAADAVSSARAIQQVIARERPGAGAPELSVRVGLSIGDVVFDGADCVGPAVVEAARLCASATGGQILATNLVRLMAGQSDDERYAAVGPMSLKGLSRAVEVVEILWETVQSWSTPLPAPLAASGSAFVGRRAELDRLHDAYRSVTTSGSRAVVLVSGEPGIGKTTVVANAIRSWHGDGAQVGLGACDEHLRAPFRPFMEALNHLVTSAPAEVLDAHVQRHGASLSPLVRALAWRVPSLPAPVTTDPESERFLLYAAVADLLTRLSELAPIVLFFDDLHWADAATASLLRSIATNAEPARLLVVGTFRDAEISGEQPMGQALAAFRRVPVVSRVHLDGLRRVDVARLLERWTGHDAGHDTDDLVAALVEETGGNAFFVIELLRHLEDTGQLRQLASAGAGAGVVRVAPESVREVLGERVDRLGADAGDVLSAAAVIGMEFSLPLLAAVVGRDEDAVLETLAGAASAALVREVIDGDGRFTFTHALVQHAILANLGSTREVRLHRRVAESLETVNGTTVNAVQLAHHWLQATRHSDTARARDWARQAGDAALHSLAPADAVTYFRQALALHDQAGPRDAQTRTDLLTRLGIAQRLSGDPDHRDTLLEASALALECEDWPRLAAAVLANHSGTFSRFGGIDEERLTMLRVAVEHASKDEERSVLLATLANELTYSGDFAERRAVVDEAMRAARAVGDDALVLRVSNLAFYALWIPDTLPERLAMTDEGMRLLPAVSDPLVRFWAAIAWYLNLVQAGRLAEAEPFLVELDTCADRLAQPALQWRARHTRATRELLFGNPDAADALARDALALGLAAGEPVAEVYFKSQSMLLHWSRGTLAELARRIRGDTPRPANAAAALTLIFTEGGRPDDASEILAAHAVDGFAAVPRDPAFLAAVAMFAESAILLGDRSPAAALYDLLVPFADQVGFDGVTTVGLLEHHAGGLAALLGRADEAVARLARSCEWHASADVPFFEARSRVQLAATLLDAGGAAARSSARDHLTRALDIAGQFGFDGVRRRARQLMDDTSGS
jgi:class 3 adenylate cyclase